MSQSHSVEAPSLGAVVGSLQQLAPLSLAAEWDNVGLLVGDRQLECARIITCLTITDAVVDEALDEGASLIVTHHPLPFRPLKRITSDAVYGRHLLRLTRNGTAVFSAHTAFDSALRGINQQWAEGLGLDKSGPLEPDATSADVGSGRFGELKQPISLESLAAFAGQFSSSACVKFVGEATTMVSRVAIACGSGGSFLPAAIQAGCDALVTGEATFHSCLEAEAEGIALVLVGHYASERFAMEWMAGWLQAEFPACQVWASRRECDPLKNVILSR